MLVGFLLSYWLGYYLTLSSLQVFASSCCILIYDGVSSSEACFCSVVVLVLARAGVFPCIFGYLTVYHSLSENYVWGALGDSSLHQRMCVCFCRTSQLEVPWETSLMQTELQTRARASLRPPVFRSTFFLLWSVLPSVSRTSLQSSGSPLPSLWFSGISAIRFLTVGRLWPWLLPSPIRLQTGHPRLSTSANALRAKSGFRTPCTFSLNLWAQCGLNRILLAIWCFKGI